MKSIVGRCKLPIIVGGSNSFIEALIDQNYEFRSGYEFCFLWFDVAMPMLHRFVFDRVDRMVATGIVEEVRKMYNPKALLRRAIRVPKFDPYFYLNVHLPLDSTWSFLGVW
ncbi:hypothetical protein L2E82_33401 [Cichorium intybus]|uniref:Uncharacterized protein n=1 Tax=Cichorium intybus TaxID=13427 RepID=A0ACB9BK37_CICIN|nr:hypothetical protein L2E82_33401 [Cichorium intybus]